MEWIVWNGLAVSDTIIFISHVHRAYDYLGPLGVLWVHMAWQQKIVLKKNLHPTMECDVEKNCMFSLFK